MTRPLNIAVIYGSTRPQRFCDAIGAWVLARISRDRRIAHRLVDPKDVADLTTFAPILAEADGFIVVTPEFNHGYPAPLKALIDHFQREWHRKAVAFVSYGGISGGLRAVEQLRQVFAELHTVSIRDSVSLAGPWGRFAPTGELTDGAEAEAALDHMLDELVWWTASLRAARQSPPAETLTILEPT